MSGVDLDHPEVIFIKRLDGTGYGFFYSTPAQFENAERLIVSGVINHDRVEHAF